MMTIVWICGAFLCGFLILFLFALCKVSGQADEHARYMEEYSEDIGPDEDMF